MVAVWNWLVANGLFRDLESACILVPIMRFMGSGFAKRIGKEVAKAAKETTKEATKEVDSIEREAASRKEELMRKAHDDWFDHALSS